MHSMYRKLCEKAAVKTLGMSRESGSRKKK